MKSLTLSRIIKFISDRKIIVSIIFAQENVRNQFRTSNYEPSNMTFQLANDDLVLPNMKIPFISMSFKRGLTRPGSVH